MPCIFTKFPMRHCRPLIAGLAFLLLAPAVFAADGECVPEPVIDMHLHFHTEETFWGPAPHNATGRMGPDSVERHVAETLAEMEKNQVVLALASAPMSWNNLDDKRLLHGVETFRPEGLDAAALRAAVKEGRVKALGELAGQYAGIAPNDPNWEPIYAIAEEHELPVGIHTGGGPPGVVRRSSPDFRFEYGNPYLLQDVLVAHPDMKVFMMHGGLAPWARETVAMMHMYPNLYIDIGAHVWVAPYMQYELDLLLEKIVRRGYADRVLFGTDQMVWPSAISIAVNHVKNADYLTEQQKRDILFENAVRFLGLSEAERRELVDRACP